MRRHGGYLFDPGSQVIISRDLPDREVDPVCWDCGRPATKYCNYAVKEPHRLLCERRLCPQHAVHIFTLDDTDYCETHAVEAGIQIHPLIRDEARRLRLPKSLVECRASCSEELNEAMREAMKRIYEHERHHAAVRT